MTFLWFISVLHVFALLINHDKQLTEIYLIMFNLQDFIKSQSRILVCPPDRFRETSHRLRSDESEENFIILLLLFLENSQLNNVKCAFQAFSNQYIIFTNFIVFTNFNSLISSIKTIPF